MDHSAFYAKNKRARIIIQLVFCKKGRDITRAVKAHGEVT